jgi:hypothetical protein
MPDYIFCRGGTRFPLRYALPALIEADARLRRIATHRAALVACPWKFDWEHLEEYSYVWKRGPKPPNAIKTLFPTTSCDAGWNLISQLSFMTTRRTVAPAWKNANLKRNESPNHVCRRVKRPFSDSVKLLCAQRPQLRISFAISWTVPVPRRGCVSVVQRAGSTAAALPAEAAVAGRGGRGRSSQWRTVEAFRPNWGEILWIKQDGEQGRRRREEHSAATEAVRAGAGAAPRSRRSLQPTETTHSAALRQGDWWRLVSP